ncbi:hypothetical protein [Leifsonia poae]|uniref:DUF2530 domain-containing protein n=1 Tax=Leifsonia poae TaxID=110933 RepID=A0A9W6HB71_9MICO|nr:hypothetical protein [Leifsonia poae]GLJ76863.1 hypothetical protein GCM10017584_24370 [Leifsonia poae]
MTRAQRDPQGLRRWRLASIVVCSVGIVAGVSVIALTPYSNWGALVTGVFGAASVGMWWLGTARPPGDDG